MKFIRSENIKPLSEMTMAKVKLSDKGKLVESIWVRKDEENRKMYLQNNAVAFLPFPSWGLEVPIADFTDIGTLKGESPDDALLTVHSEAYDSMKEDGLLDDDDIFLIDVLFALEQKRQAEAAKE